MNYKDIIEKGKLIYSSQLSDKRLISWPLNSIKLSVSYYKETPMTPIDQLICKLISNNNGQISKQDIGLTLGYDIATTRFKGQAFYEDVAEKAMFDRLLSQLTEWQLISIDSKEGSEQEQSKNADITDDETNSIEIVRLTKLGDMALEKGKKFTFFQSDILLYSNFFSTGNQFVDYNFVYPKELGITANILDTKKTIVDLDKFNPNCSSQFIERLELQLNEDWEGVIYDITPRNITLPMEFTNVDFKLYKSNEELHLIAFSNNGYSTDITNIINAESNIRPRNQRIKLCLYYKLINEENFIFSYNDLIIFWDVLEENEYNQLLNDQRVDWNDSLLFDLIVSSEYCSTSTWSTITKIVPLDVIKRNLVTYRDYIDWRVFSARIDISFILTNKSLNWSYETVLNRDDISIPQAQQILLNPAINDIELDWDSIEKFLTIEFVRDNIHNLNLDFYRLTSWLPKENLSIIFECIDKLWNWSYIANYLAINVIAENIGRIELYLNPSIIIERCFSSDSNTDFCLQNDALRDFFVNSIRNDKLNNFSLRDKSHYVWTHATIKYFEEIGLLKWESLQYEKGFTQFDFVSWTKDFFIKYNYKLTSEQDRTYVSSVISDMSIISDFPNFKWDWSALSSNINLAYRSDFISSHSKQIDVKSWLLHADSQLIELYFDILNLNNAFNNNQLATIISSKVTDEFIQKHKDLAWDTYAFTKAIGSYAVLDKSILKKYIDRWNWDLLSSIASYSYVLDDIENPWTDEVITKAIAASESNVTSLIGKYLNRINWHILSESIEYTDFEPIAEIYCNEWEWDIINRRFAPLFSNILLDNYALRDFLNWESISQHASTQVLLDSIRLNSELLNWEDVTQKVCPDLTIEALLEENSINNWDWIYISKNAEIHLLEQASEYLQIPLDWNILSRRFSADFILNNLVHYQEKWDWSVIWNKKFTYTFAIDKIQLLAQTLNNLNDGVKEVQWNAFTHILEIENLLQLTDEYNPIEGYFWNYEFVYKNISNIQQFVSEKHAFVDWTALSLSKSADKFFYYDAQTFDARIWKIIVKKKLNDPLFKWDFKSLTRLESVQAGHSIFFKIDSDKWDWDYISSKGSCLLPINNGEANLRKYRERINFALLSKREDIGLSENIITSYIAEEWGWASLSANPTIEMSMEFVFNYKSKPWDWSALSRNKSIKFEGKRFYSIASNIFKDDIIVNSFDWHFFVSRNDIKLDMRLLELIHKSVIPYWHTITSNTMFIPSIDVVELAIGDGVDVSNLNWDAISKSKDLIQISESKDGHSKVNTDFISKYSNYINWKFATQNSLFDIYNDTLLICFKDYVDWSFISDEIIDDDKLSIEYLIKFKKYLNWYIINNRLNYQLINEDALSYLSNYLDWAKVSNLELNFTKQLLDEYVDNWDWSILIHNKAFKRVSNENILDTYKHKLNVAEFVDYFGSHSTKIYHFTHLFNVLEVLKSKKILSRNRAQDLSKLKFDSAGGVVGRTAKAHSYARFYFRPNTPTQFYNECLGWDYEMTIRQGKKDVSYYPQALNLGLPKCPIPVFLEFDLREVLSKMSSVCYYSNGNMQTNWAKVYKVEDNPNHLQHKYLYNSMGDAYNISINECGDWNAGHFHTVLNDIKDHSQQEFLIKDEFDFSKIESLRIYCYDENTAELLRTYLENDPIKERIVIGDCFSYQNRNLQFHINKEQNIISVSTNYDGQGDAYFMVKGNVDIANTKCIKKQVSDGIIMYPEVEIKKNDNPCEIYFIDKRARTTDWLVYSNNIGSSKAQKTQYQLDQNLLDSFINIESKVTLDLKCNLFKKHMINSYHGIAHTARVLFATHLIVNLSDEIDDKVKNLAYYAAIIHDLGKTNDREGAIHGLNSILLYQGFIDKMEIDDISKLRLKNAIRYHSFDDNLCPEIVKDDVLWKILKDADALDRSRFSGRGCDRNYLRLPLFKTNEGLNIIHITNILPSLTKYCKWENPYNDIVKTIKLYVL